MKKITTFFGSLFLLTTSVFAANLYVNHTGSSTAPYDTEAKAARVIQVALDAAGSGDTILIKADANYVMNGTDQPAAQIDVDHNPCTIRGYYLTVGDQDYSGAYYKDGTHGWVVIDANNGAYHVFSTGTLDDLAFMNIKFIHLNSGKDSIYAMNPQGSYVFQNLWFTGGDEAIETWVTSVLVEDCKFEGGFSSDIISYDTQGVLTVRNCLFKVTTQPASCIYFGVQAQGNALIMENNVFDINAFIPNGIIEPSDDFQDGLELVANNTVYVHPGISSDVFLDLNGMQNYIIYNNIITGCAISIYGATGNNNLSGWNCLYNNTANWTLHTGDITSDPLFVDAINGDFRLKSASPCINTCKPAYYPGGKASMGARQPGLSDVFGGI
jgi:hypothetical protein